MNDSEPPKLYCYHCGQPVEKEQSSCPTCGEDLDWSNDTPPPEEGSVMSLDAYKTRATLNFCVSIFLLVVAGGFVVYTFAAFTPEAGKNAAILLVMSLVVSGFLLADCAAIKALVAEIERLRSGKKKVVPNGRH